MFAGEPKRRSRVRVRLASLHLFWSSLYPSAQQPVESDQVSSILGWPGGIPKRYPFPTGRAFAWSQHGRAILPIAEQPATSGRSSPARRLTSLVPTALWRCLRSQEYVSTPRTPSLPTPSTAIRPSPRFASSPAAERSIAQPATISTTPSFLHRSSRRIQLERRTRTLRRAHRQPIAPLCTAPTSRFIGAKTAASSRRRT